MDTIGIIANSQQAVTRIVPTKMNRLERSDSLAKNLKHLPEEKWMALGAAIDETDSTAFLAACFFRQLGRSLTLLASPRPTFARLTALPRNFWLRLRRARSEAG